MDKKVAGHHRTVQKLIPHRNNVQECVRCICHGKGDVQAVKTKLQGPARLLLHDTRIVLTPAQHNGGIEMFQPMAYKAVARDAVYTAPINFTSYS